MNNGGQFDDVKHLVAGTRGVNVFALGDLDAGIWSVGTSMGLIDDVPTCAELVSRIVDEAEHIIFDVLADLIAVRQDGRAPV